MPGVGRATLPWLRACSLSPHTLLSSPVQLMRTLGPLMGNSSCYNSHELKEKTEQSQKNAKGRNAVPLTMVAVGHFLAAQDPPSSQILARIPPLYLNDSGTFPPGQEHRY